MKAFFNRLKIRIYRHYLMLLFIFEDKLQDLINKLNGRDFDEPDFDVRFTPAQINRQNSKLRRGIERIVRTIYDANGRLKSDFRTDDADLMSITNDAHKKSLIERLEEAQLTQKMLDNPTDESGTDDRMVMHNVKNAHKYVAAQQKRVIMKALTQAMKDDNIEEVKRLKREAAELNRTLNGSR